jgi:SAM-dependent methyltransferase
MTAKRRRDPGRFDAEYYARFYRDPRTRVADARTTRRLADFVRAYVRMLDLDVRTVLDLGCGLGWWRDAVRTWRPKCRYHGVEVSEYLVEKYGWEPGSVVDYRAPAPFDLVVCQGVLQYLPDAAARDALDNLARSSRRALYLEALTSADWRDNCDTDRTDGGVHLRTGAWYRRRLRPHFFNCGGGLFVRRDAGVTLFDLERTD